jgi:hypothetical protein
LTAIKHAIDFYVAHSNGNHLIKHFRGVLDLHTGQAASMSTAISKTAIIDQMKASVPGVITTEFCSACWVHGHCLKNCPAKKKLDAYFTLNKA